MSAAKFQRPPLKEQRRVALERLRPESHLFRCDRCNTKLTSRDCAGHEARCRGRARP